MGEAEGILSNQLQADLETIARFTRDAAQKRAGRSLELLALLRLLEALHQEIRDDLFQSSLPDNRQALYALLKDIESAGGWPYIHRMKLQAFLSEFPLDFLATDASEPNLGQTETRKSPGTRKSLE